MTAQRLTEKHPTLQKIRKLEELAESLGITLSVGNCGQIIVNDEAYPGIDFQYRDSEQALYGYDTTSSFPHFAETKLIYEKDD